MHWHGACSHMPQRGRGDRRRVLAGATLGLLLSVQVEYATIAGRATE